MSKFRFASDGDGSVEVSLWKITRNSEFICATRCIDNPSAVSLAKIKIENTLKKLIADHEAPSTPSTNR